MSLAEEPSLGADTEAPPESLLRMYERIRQQEWQGQLQALQKLRDTLTARQRELLAPEVRRRIKAALTAQENEPRNPGRRFRSIVEARAAHADLAGLRHAHRRLYGEAGAIMKGDFDVIRLHDLVSIGDLVNLPPIVYTPPDPNKEKMFYPPFGGSWDRVQQNQASADGRIVENMSYVDGTGRMGSRLVARNHDASDVDLLCAAREGGYLVQFKTRKAGALQVKVDVTALVCQHRVTTEDEWGWSDFRAITNGRIVMATFWNWDDVEPANEISHNGFAPGIDCSGDGESFPGTRVQALPGERRILALYSSIAFPSGVSVWIYVGLADRIWAFLNDVSIDISLDSAWMLNSLAVRTI